MRLNSKNNKLKASKIGAFFKRNIIWIVVFSLIGIFLIPFLIYRIQDFVSKLKQNKEDNITEIKSNQVKNEVKKNNTVNTNSSASSDDLEYKYKVIKKKFSNRVKLSDTRLWISLKNDSHNLAFALGTHATENRPLFGADWLPDRPDSSAFFENEAEALRILKKYPNTFDILAELYYSLATRSNNLKLDIKKYLSQSQIDELRKRHKNYKRTWL